MLTPGGQVPGDVNEKIQSNTTDFNKGIPK